MIQESHFSKEITIHQRNLVPYVAYMVLEGEVLLIDKAGNARKAKQGEIIGLNEVWNHLPYPYEVRTCPGASILNLNRSLLDKIRQALFNPLA